MSIRVIVADDHEVVRTGLASLLADTEISIVGEAQSESDAVEMARQSQPDLVLMDIRMQDGDGLGALETLQREMPDLPVIMLSTYDNPTYVARAVALGARDYLLKGSSRQQIIDSIRAAVLGKLAQPGSAFDRVAETLGEVKPVAEAPPTLTRREAQVLRHVALGLSNKEIGQSLGISVETVKEHVQNILRKISVSDRTQAAVWAMRRGIVD
jgi:DNA-binding NarL/FixJ family response regulator